MAFRATDASDEQMSEINMTPLVDVMLVLLIIFMVTVPVMKQAVQVELPRAPGQAISPKAQTVRLVITAEGVYDLDGSKLSAAQLRDQLIQLAAREPQPSVLIEGDRQARYEWVARALSWAQHSGIRKVGFVTEPSKETAP